MLQPTITLNDHLSSHMAVISALDLRQRECKPGEALLVAQGTASTVPDGKPLSGVLRVTPNVDSDQALAFYYTVADKRDIVYYSAAENAVAGLLASGLFEFHTDGLMFFNRSFALEERLRQLQPGEELELVCDRGKERGFVSLDPICKAWIITDQSQHEDVLDEAPRQDPDQLWDVAEMLAESGWMLP